MEIIYTLIAICWFVFFFSFFVMGRFTKRTVEHQGRIGRLAYIIPLFLSVFLLINGVSSQTVPGIEVKQSIYPLYVQILPNTSGLMATGLILAVLGLLFGLWARVTLGSNWSGFVTIKENHELVQRGPYALVRHPIYSGMLLLFLGTAVALGTLGGFIGFPLFFIGSWIKLKQEEDVMLRHFREDYIEYQKRVKALIPFIL